jgi:ribulose-bisphosphate carboxylase large chain
VTEPTRIEADYLIETAYDPSQAAEAMAGEQSSGTFVPIPGETPELKKRSAARIETLEVVEEVNEPSLPGAGRPKGQETTYRRARVTLSWPMVNFGPSLPNLVATIAGNLFELKQFSGLRLLDIRLPAIFADVYPGPKFGIPGTRKLAGVEGRPIIGTIVKPSVGFGPEETAALTKTLCEAGIDFIKDDELQSDGPHCPFDERARAVMRVINDHADCTGKKVMFAFNLTGDLDQMRRRHDLVRDLGGTCIMASLNSVGLVGMIELGRFSELPIHAHRNGWGYLSREPMLGWSYVAWLSNKFCEDDESVIASARACLTPMFNEKPCIVMPVFSSGQSAKQAPGTFAALGTTDLIFAAGGGIMAHPDGPAAGVTSLCEAWEAATARVSLAEYAKERPALAKALEAYAA